MRGALVGVVMLGVSVSAEAQGMGDRQACIRAAQKEFTEIVEDIIKTAVSKAEYGGPNKYAAAGNPKAFALCINWALARPESQVTRSWGFSTRGEARERKAVDSLAISYCAQGQMDRSENCNCRIVSRDGVTAIDFPENWSGGRCK